jgi:hypothetical protein
MGLGRKISRNAKHLGRKTKHSGAKLGHKVNAALDSVNAEKTLDTVEKVSGGIHKYTALANKAGLSSVPYVGQASMALELGSGAVNIGAKATKPHLKNVREGANALEKMNRRKKVEAKANAPDGKSNFV